jgi:DNA (cytosine-5)-methyltransferase 1
MVVNNTKSMLAKRKVRAISLFCGAGGMDLGFEKAGISIVASVDFDAHCKETFELNGRGDRFYHKSVADFYKEDLQNVLRYPIDVVFGGPPCQGFSTAGKRNIRDPRNKLWRDFIKVVKMSKPKIVVFENVPGLAYGSSAFILQTIIAMLNTLGYNTHWEILNSADFGVAQHRRRLILIGARPPIETDPILAPGRKRHLPAKAVLAPLLKARRLHNHDIPNNHPRVMARWRKLRPGETDPKFRRVRLDPNTPAPTIRAGGQFSKSATGLAHLGGFHPPFHYAYPRQLSVRETAVLQGFPNAYVFSGSRTMAGRQVGNAVPVPLAAELAKRVLRALRLR